MPEAFFAIRIQMPSATAWFSSSQRSHSSAEANGRCGRPSSAPTLGQNGSIASYEVNDGAVAHARRLIEARQYVLDSEWGEVQPSADDENAFIESHSWDEYAAWHLGLTEGATNETKARYGFVMGDFRRVHRSALIACQYRAAEWKHKEVELAAHDLLQLFDEKSG